MNYNKIIKDLKERNDKLSEQYRLCDIRKVHLECENKQLQQDLEKANKVIDDIEEYIDSQNSDMTNDLDFIGSTLTLNEEYVILNLFRRLKDKIKELKGEDENV